MGVNKVIYNGETLVDLSEDTVTAQTLAEGVTAHGADGEIITGAMSPYIKEEIRPFIDTSKLTSFYYFCYSNSRNSMIDKLDTSNGEIFTSMFYNNTEVKEIPYLNTSKGRLFTRMFFNCYSLTSLPVIDLSCCEDAAYMFRGCTALRSLELTTSKSDLDMTTFQNCTALENITIGEGWDVSIYLDYATAVTQESLHKMIENLADLTGKTAKRFSTGDANLEKIDTAHRNMLSSKNWIYP